MGPDGHQNGRRRFSRARVGKLKAPFLTIMYGERHIEEMRKLKLALDPKGLYGIGNLFTLEGRQK